MMNNDESRNLGGVAFLPLLVFLCLYIGCGLAFTLLGIPKPFSFLPRHVALLAGTLVAFLLWKKGPIEEKLKVFCSGMGDSGVMMIVLIYLLAGGFQGAAAAIGGKTSVVNFCLQFVPPSFLIPGVFLMCCFISTAIGTSMGTIAAMAPVAIGVAQGAGLNLAAVCAAVICGSYFGDNLSMISDTTIAATKTQGCEMKDKFRTNFLIVLPAAIINIVILLVITMNANYAVSGDLSYNFLQVVPYLVVLIGALIGFNVFAVLGVGTILSIAVGLYTGTIPVNEIFTSMGSGVTNMYDITVISIVVCAISALMKAGGGIQAILDLIRRRVKSRRGAMLGIGVLCAGVDVATANNTISIVMTGELARDISQEYGIDPKQTASLLDICTSVVQGLLPYGAQLLYASAATKEQVSSFAIVPYCFYPMLMAVCVVGYILFSKKTK